MFSFEGRSLIRTFLAGAPQRCRNLLSERRASSEEKEENRFGFFERNDYLCTRWRVIVRLVAQHRVFFDAVYSRMWNWVRLPIRNPIFLQFPQLPLDKERMRILTKLRKIEGRTKRIHSFFIPSASNFATLSQSFEKNELLLSQIPIF